MARSHYTTRPVEFFSLMVSENAVSRVYATAKPQNTINAETKMRLYDRLMWLFLSRFNPRRHNECSKHDITNGKFTDIAISSSANHFLSGFSMVLTWATSAKYRGSPLPRFSVTPVLFLMVLCYPSSQLSQLSVTMVLCQFGPQFSSAVVSWQLHQIPVVQQLCIINVSYSVLLLASLVS